MKTDYIIFKTKKLNNYLYSFYNNKILLIHPVLYFLLNLKKEGVNLEKWMKKNVKFEYKIDTGSTYSSKEFKFYYRKYIFLEENDFFREKQIDNSVRYNSDDVKYQLANTSQITFEVTDRCNLSCEYCIYGKFYVNRDKPINVNLDAKLAKSILMSFVELWNSSLNNSHNKTISIGFYGGEALTNFDFIVEIVEFAKNIKTVHYNFSFHMTTNGVLLSRYMDFLVENNFNLSISLDGGTAFNNIHRKFSDNESAYNTIYNNIIDLYQKHKEYFKKKVGFISVLHANNSEKELLSFFKEKFGKVPLMINLDNDSLNPDFQQEFLEISRKNDNISMNDKEMSLLEKEHFIGNAEDLVNFLYVYSGNVKKKYSNLMYENRSTSKLPTGSCDVFSRKVFITVRGKILPCERIGHSYELGNISSENFILDYDFIAKKYNNHFDLIESQCNKCYSKNSCGICMFKEELYKDNFRCSGFMDYKTIKKMFVRNMSYLEDNPELYLRIINNVSFV